MNWESFRIGVGFFAFYCILAFCFICGPLALIGYVFRLGNQTLLITSGTLTITLASLLSMLTSRDVNEEVTRQRETGGQELPPIRKADNFQRGFRNNRLAKKDFKKFQEEMK